jgi:hypothetical protein
MGLLLLFIAVLSITVTILSHDAVDLLLGSAICLAGGIHIFKIYNAVKYGKVCVFKGVRIGSELGNEVGNLMKGMLTGNRKYILQSDDKTVETLAKGSLNLHKGQKYRFYLPDGSLTDTEGKAAVKLHQFYGFETLT